MRAAADSVIQLGDAGFTLVELLVVLSLIALLLAVVPPVVSAVMPGLQLATSARQLAGTLRAERLAAGAAARETLVRFDTRAGGYGAGRIQTLPEGVGLRVLAAAPAEVLDGAAQIRFYPDGSSSGGRVALEQGQRRIVVTVDWLTGRVEIEP